MNRSQKPEAKSQKRRLLFSGFWLLASGFFLGCASTTPEQAPAPAPKMQSAPVQDPRIGEMQVLLAELLERLEVLNARLQRIESGAAPATVSAAPQTATARPRPPQPRPLVGAALEERYRQALAAYGKTDLDQARKLFQEVLEADPNGDLADNALYWIAETHFVSAKYNEAMRIYQRILTDYSEENKAPDAMFKMGLAYVKLGDLALARSTFEKLIQRYPYSTPAASAKLEIKRIQY